jgi:hypothetical protein
MPLVYSGVIFYFVSPAPFFADSLHVFYRMVNYKTKVKERGRVVLSGYVLLSHIPSLL